MDFEYKHKYMLAGIYGVGYFDLVDYDDCNYDKDDLRRDFEYISGTLYTNEKQSFNEPQTVSGYFQEDEDNEWTIVVKGKASSSSSKWFNDINSLL